MKLFYHNIISILLLVVVALYSCNHNAQFKQIKAKIIDKSYTEATTTMMPIPYNVGNVHGVRLQPIHHPEKYTMLIKYIDENCTNYGTIENKTIDYELYDSLNIGDTIFVNTIVKVNKNGKKDI